MPAHPSLTLIPGRKPVKGFRPVYYISITLNIQSVSGAVVSLQNTDTGNVQFQNL